MIYKHYIKHTFGVCKNLEPTKSYGVYLQEFFCKTTGTVYQYWSMGTSINQINRKFSFLAFSHVTHKFYTMYTSRDTEIFSRVTLCTLRRELLYHFNPFSLYKWHAYLHVARMQEVLDLKLLRHPYKLAELSF